MNISTMKKALRVSAVLSAGVLAACSDNNNSTSQLAPPVVEPPAEVTLEYEVSVVNLTLGQPMSPVALLIHESTQDAIFSIGAPASEALEQLAESGDNSALLEEIGSVAQVSGESPLGPGSQQAFTLEVPRDDDTGLAFTLVSMLVNTNDAFTAVNNVDIASLEVGDAMAFSTTSYDAGTEANSESAGTIPGPADGGEGFNAARDDLANQVTAHSGVVTSDGGLENAVLSQQHRWDNPVLLVTLTRTR